jgi:hypothetical protein
MKTMTDHIHSLGLYAGWYGESATEALAIYTCIPTLDPINHMH